MSLASKGDGGGISIPAAGFEFSARPGFTLFIPSVFPEATPNCIPDLRTQYMITAPKHTTVYLATLQVQL